MEEIDYKQLLEEIFGEVPESEEVEPMTTEEAIVVLE